MSGSSNEEPVFASQTTTLIGKIITYYDTDGAQQEDPTNTNALYELIATANSAGVITSGHPGRDNNPGDLAALGANLDYTGLIGVDPPAPGTKNADGTPAPGIVIFDDRQDGLSALVQHIEYALDNYGTENLGSYVSRYSGGATDDVEAAGFNLQESIAENLTDQNKINSFVSAIIMGEGGETPVIGEFFSGDGLTVTANNLVNLVVSNVTNYSLDASLDDILDQTIVNGQLIYNESSASDTATIVSNISQSYSGNSLTYSLGTIDTDTFYNLGNGSTIIAGSLDNNLYITSEGNLWYGVINTQDEEIALSTGFVTNPGQGTLSGTMGTSDLVIANANSATYTGTVQGQIIVGAGSGDNLIADAPNETLIALTTDGGNYTFTNEGTTGVTEIASPGMTDVDDSTTNNIFSFGGGTNVLVGDLGNNIFIENPTVTSGTNIIWGGGGTSTYSLSGYIDILMTTGTPTPNEIGSLSSLTSQLAPDDWSQYYGDLEYSGDSGDTPDYTVTAFSDTESIDDNIYPFAYYYSPPLSLVPNDYIIDPTSKDIISGFSGIYTPNQVYYYIETEFGGGSDISAFTRYYDGNLYIAGYIQGNDGVEDSIFNPEPSDQGDLVINEYSVSGYISDPGFEQPILYLVGSIVMANFVNGDLGITFSGDAPIISGGSISTEIVDPSDPDSVYAYDKADYILLGQGSSGGNGDNSLEDNNETVLSGATSYDVLVGLGGTQSVLSGGITDGSNVTSGGSVLVTDGGTASATSLGNSGLLVVSAGGSAYGTNVLSGGAEVVQSGGIETGDTIYSGGVVSVLVGGQVQGATIASGGQQLEASGATAYSSLIEGGGSEIVQGVAVSSTVNNGGIQTVSSGGATILSVVQNGGYQIITSGGSAFDGTIDSGGQQLISSAGSATSTTISAGGSEFISAGGVVSSTTVSSGGKQIIGSGGSAVGAVLIGTGQQLVSSGGAAVSTIISTGGSEAISASGTASSTTVLNGGTQTVLSGGSAIGATVNSGGVEKVSSGGSANAVTVNYGGNEYVSFGGISISATVNSGGRDIIFSGAVGSAALINSGVNEIVSSGGIAIGTSLAGGNQFVSGTASGTVINHGVQNVYSGGSATGSLIASGGSQIVLAGGAASATIISSGGSETVSSGAMASATSVGNGASLYGYGSEFATSVGSGGNLVVHGVATGTLISSGSEAVSSGGIDRGATITSSGHENVYAGGTASGTTLTSGAWQTVSSGASVNGTSVGSGSILYGYGLETGTVIGSGGKLLVRGGAGASNSIVNAGGYEIVSAGASVSATINSGGAQQISSGAAASASTVNNGGKQYVSAGGTVISTVLNSGGVQTIYAGGTASGTIISAGGTEIVSSGGTVSGTTISSGGNEILVSGATVTGSISFSGGNATLSIGGTVLPTNVISGFDAGGIITDDIVLTSYTYSSSDSATLGSGNVLTLQLNGTISTLQFDPSQSFAGEYFAIQQNSQHQVVLVDPPIISSATSPGIDDYHFASAAMYSGTSPTLPITRGPMRMSFLANSGSAAPGADNRWPINSPQLLNQTNMKSFMPTSLSGAEYTDPDNSFYSLPVSAHLAGGLAGDIIIRNFENGNQNQVIIHSGFGQ